MVREIEFRKLPPEAQKLSAEDRAKFQHYKKQFSNVSEEEASRLALDFVTDATLPGSETSRRDLLARGLAARGDQDPAATIATINGNELIEQANQAYNTLTNVAPLLGFDLSPRAPMLLAADGTVGMAPSAAPGSGVRSAPKGALQKPDHRLSGVLVRQPSKTL